MKKVLFICPHFPPVNAPDHQRIRMLLPHFREYGWQSIVLTVSPEHVHFPSDPSLKSTIPDDVPIHYTKGIPPRVTHFLGFDNLAFRTYHALRRAGNRILQQETLDFIYFSTTHKAFLNLGPYWQRKFSVPFGVDIQDPLVNDYYEKTNTPPPGGQIKFSLSQRQGRNIEQHVLPQAAHITAVNQHYIDELQSRVPHVSPEKCAAISFPYSHLDQETARQQGTPLWLKNSRAKLILSAGRAGRDLHFAYQAFFKAIRTLENRNDVSVFFVGTTYGKTDSENYKVLPLLQRDQLKDDQLDVREIPERIPLLEVLRAQQSAAVNCVFGSTDSRYSASKLFPVIKSGCPVLAILHTDSSAAEFMGTYFPDYLCAFDTTDTENTLAERIRIKLQANLAGMTQILHTNLPELDSLEAKSQAQRISKIFDAASLCL